MDSHDNENAQLECRPSLLYSGLGIGDRWRCNSVFGKSHIMKAIYELHIPKLRTGSYFPSLREPRRMVEKALTAVIQEASI